MRALDRGARPRRGRTFAAAAAVLAVVLLALWYFGYRLNVPRAHVSPPGAAATPVDVARAYVAAYDARDLSTLHAFDPGFDVDAHRFRALGSFDDLVVEDVRYDDEDGLGPPTGADPDHGRVYVPVTMTAHGMETTVTDLAFRDGRMRWGFFLERPNRSQPWVVVDQGVG